MDRRQKIIGVHGASVEDGRAKSISVRSNYFGARLLELGVPSPRKIKMTTTRKKTVTYIAHNPMWGFISAIPIQAEKVSHLEYTMDPEKCAEWPTLTGMKNALKKSIKESIYDRLEFFERTVEVKQTSKITRIKRGTK
jgi:hypothetical protein